MAKDKEDDSKKPSKAAALRESLEINGWDADLQIHQTFLQNTYGLHMDKQQISQYKSAERRKASNSGRLPKLASAPLAAIEHSPAPRVSGKVSDVQAVVNLIEALRTAQVSLGREETARLINAVAGLS